MKKSQLAAQMYTLRNFTKTESDLAETFRKVKEIGFDAVQISGLQCSISDAELARLAAESGLRICATHEPGEQIMDNVDAVIERLKTLSCPYTAYPWPHIRPVDAADAVKIAHRLNASALAMKKAGLTLCYHNHAFEFEPFGDKLLLDIIYDEAPAIQSELDTFWVQAGGGDPGDWVRKLAGREPLLHLKDYTVKDNERRYAPVGSGNLKWDEIIPAAEAGGVKYFIVEQDSCYEQCPFDALRASFLYLTDRFVKE